jgi:hypothetical protein
MMFEIGTLLYSCTNKTEAIILQKGKAIVTGKVVNMEEGIKSIRFAGSGIVKDTEDVVIVDTLGNFRIEFELYHPQIVNITFKKGFARLYLCDSDSIHLCIDEKLFNKEITPSFKISGKGAGVAVSKNILDYTRFRGQETFNPMQKNKSGEEYLSLLRNKLHAEDSVLQCFCKTKQTTSEFKKWAKSDIVYGVANYVVFYNYMHRDNKDDLFDKQLFPVNDDLSIINGMYGAHLSNYVSFNYWSNDSIARDLLTREKYYQVFTETLNKIKEKEEKGLSRDIMCYNQITYLYKYSFKDYCTVLEDVDKYIDNELLCDELRKKKFEHVELKNKDISYFDLKTKEEKQILGDFWKVLKEKHRGKVIYLDIFAVW